MIHYQKCSDLCSACAGPEGFCGLSSELCSPTRITMLLVTHCTLVIPECSYFGFNGDHWHSALALFSLRTSCCVCVVLGPGKRVMNKDCWKKAVV